MRAFYEIALFLFILFNCGRLAAMEQKDEGQTKLTQKQWYAAFVGDDAAAAEENKSQGKLTQKQWFLAFISPDAAAMERNRTQAKSGHKTWYVAVAGYKGGHASAKLMQVLFDDPYRTGRLVIGIDERKLVHDEREYRFGLLAENYRFDTITSLFIKRSQSIVFLFDASEIDQCNLEICIRQLRYTDPQKQTKILVVIGHGYVDDLTDIMKFSQKTPSHIILSWCKKPYQQQYLRDKVLAIIDKDDARLRELEDQFEEKERQDFNFLLRFSEQMHAKKFAREEMMREFENIDYSRLADILDSAVDAIRKCLGPKTDEQQILPHNLSELFTDEQQILLHNLNELFMIAGLEGNMRIVKWMRS